MNCVSIKEQKGAGRMKEELSLKKKGETRMKRGFTLIEILIVIMVISILVGISLPHMKGMRDEGNTAKAAGELRTLSVAVESFYIHNDQQYPVQTTSADAMWQSVANSLTAASPTIIKTVLKDPFRSTVEYRYATSDSSNSQYYVVFSVGPDGEADITGISTAGVIAGGPDDDIYISNGEAGTGGF